MSYIPQHQFDRGACMAKVQSPSLFHATNRAWLLACALKQRMAVYRCPICRHLHVSHDVDGADTVLCTSPTLGVS